MGGIAYLDFVRGLAARVESDWAGVQADLEAIRKALLQVGRGVWGGEIEQGI